VLDLYEKRERDWRREIERNKRECTFPDIVNGSNAFEIKEMRMMKQTIFSKTLSLRLSFFLPYVQPLSLQSCQRVFLFVSLSFYLMCSLSHSPAVVLQQKTIGHHPCPDYPTQHLQERCERGGCVGEERRKRERRERRRYLRTT